MATFLLNFDAVQHPLSSTLWPLMDGLLIVITRWRAQFISINNVKLMKFTLQIYAKIQVFTDPYSPVKGKNLQSCLYMGECRSMKTCILAYIMQRYKFSDI